MKPNLPFSNVVSTAAAAPDQQQREAHRGTDQEELRFLLLLLSAPHGSMVLLHYYVLQQQHKDGSWLSVHEHLPTLPAAAADYVVLCAWQRTTVEVIFWRIYVCFLMSIWINVSLLPFSKHLRGKSSGRKPDSKKISAFYFWNGCFYTLTTGDGVVVWVRNGAMRPQRNISNIDSAEMAILKKVIGVSRKYWRSCL